MGCGSDANEAALGSLVARFYGKVRCDAQLAPVFADAIEDWPRHIETLTAFWSSVMLGSACYKGNPMAAHLRHRERITPALFERWLALWGEAADETMPPDAAATLVAKAGRIAQSLNFALAFRPNSTSQLPAVPA